MFIYLTTLTDMTAGTSDCSTRSDNLTNISAPLLINLFLSYSRDAQ